MKPVYLQTDSPWSRAIASVGGYVWWYFDALLESGDALVCILFAGAVFSPKYAARLRQGERALPTDHAAVNLALYRGGRSLAWVMTEYDAIDAREGGVRVGGSSLERDGAGWRIRIDERSANFGQPVMARFGRRVVGEIRVEPLAAPLPEQALVAGGATHAWQVLAPRARVSASFPGVGFRGEGIGYHDRNHGDARLDDGFSRWGWARFHGEDTTHVLYSMTPREGGRRALWVSARDDAPAQIVEARALPEGASMRLPYGMALPSRFGVERDPPASPLACEPTTLLEEAPFYARYRARLVGAPASEGIGEQLDLDRFRSRWTQFLVGFKTRRA